MVGQTTLENRAADLNLWCSALVFDWNECLGYVLTWLQESFWPPCTKGSLSTHTRQQQGPDWGSPVGAHGPCWADRTPWVLQAKTQHPFASCCSWISGWRVRSVFSATLIDGFIFQSIYLLNYPSVSKKSFLVNMVIGQSGWQQKHILVEFREKDDIPQFQFASGFPCQQSVN